MQNVEDSAKQNALQIWKRCGNSSRERRKPSGTEYNELQKRLPQNAKRVLLCGSRLAHQWQRRPPKMEEKHGENLVHCRLQLLLLDPRALPQVRKGLGLAGLPLAGGAYGRPCDRPAAVLLLHRLLLLVQLRQHLMCPPRRRILPKMRMVSKQWLRKKVSGALVEGGYSRVVIFASSLHFFSYHFQLYVSFY